MTTLFKEPKAFEELTSEEKGLLLLAHHEGKTIQYWEKTSKTWQTTADKGPGWYLGQPYRVKPEPEETEKTVYIAGLYSVTLRFIDGVVQPTATVEKI